MSPGRAESLFTDNFSATVGSLASDPPDLSGKHPVFLDNHTAVVSPNGYQTPYAGDIASVLSRDQNDIGAARRDLNDLFGQQSDQDAAPQLVSSTFPLRTDDGAGQIPVDLSLDRQGSAFRPENPLVDVKLPDSIDHNVALGDQGIKVDLGTGESAPANPTNGGSNLFYADAAPSTDVVLAPISPGLETFYQLRAPESPDHFRMHFTLPDGARLSDSGDGGARIVQGGETLGAVYPPAATDAAGNTVDVSLSVDGDSLVLDVPHSEAGIHYPISVDPVVDLYTWSTEGHGIFADWIANQTTGSPYSLRRTCRENVDCTSGTTGPMGLYSLAPPNQAIAQNAAATWQYQVPHYPWTTAYVSVANLGPMYFNPRTDANANPFMFAGIYPDASGSGYVDTQAQTTGAGNLYWQLNAGSATTAKQAAFGLWSWTARSPSAWRDAYDGGAAIWLGDKENPTLTDVSHSGISIGQADWSFSNWVDDAMPSVTVATRDNGLGIKELQVPDTNGELKTVSEQCQGTNASPCPQIPSSVTATYDTSEMDDGANITGIVATDAVDKSATRTFVVRVDHSLPFVSDVTGGLSDQPSGDPYTLRVTARDGYDVDSSLWESGVKKITEYVNGEPVYTTPSQTCTATEGSCPMSFDHTINPDAYQPGGDGLLLIGVSATDQLGHESEVYEWHVPVPATTIASGPSGPTSEPAPRFTYHSSRLESTFECRIDQGSFEACPTAGYAPSTPLANGSHTFSVRAVDAAGHVDPTPASRDFVVDADAPTVTASGPMSSTPEAWVDQQSYDLGVEAEDPTEGVTDLEFLIDGARVGYESQSCGGGCSLTRTFTVDMSDYQGGAHAAKLVATDAGGHTSELTWTITVNPTGAIGPDEAAATARAAMPAVVGPSQPVEEQTKLLDPSLEAQGSEFSATSSGVAASVAPSYAGGTTVGFEGFEATFTPEGQGNAQGTLLADHAAAYPNVSPGVDAFVRPTALGTATTEQIRTPSADTDFSWRVDLAGDQHLEMLDDGSVALVQPYPLDPSPSPFPESAGSAAQTSLRATADAESQLRAAQGQYVVASNDTPQYQPIAVMQASPARDATGQAIPVSLSFSGNVVTMHVSAGASAAYPVLARAMLTSAAAADSVALCAHAFREHPEWQADACYRSEYQYDPDAYQGPDIPDVGPQDARQLFNLDPADLRAYDEQQAAMDAVDAKLGGSSGGGYADLNAQEKAFCLEWILYCKVFNDDRYIAYHLTDHMFTGSRPDSDNTKANAFQHAYWTALMTESAGKKRHLAINYGKAHEGHAPHSRDGDTRRASRMDIINDRMGYYKIAKRGTRNRGDQQLCANTEGRTKLAIKIAKNENPYNYRDKWKEVFRELKDDTPQHTEVHFNGRSCGSGFD